MKYERPAVMVDIETMSTEKNAAIMSIGAVKFDVAGQSSRDDLLNGETYYSNISLESNEKFGRHISASTISWWFKQSKEAQIALFEEPILPLNTALVKYRMWLEKCNADRYYANDPDFDIVILNDGFAAVGDRSPFAYYQHRSVRTTIELAYPHDEPMPNIETGVAHNALDDAIKQAITVQHCYTKLHGGQHVPDLHLETAVGAD